MIASAIELIELIAVGWEELANPNTSKRHTIKVATNVHSVSLASTLCRLYFLVSISLGFARAHTKPTD